MTQPRRDAGVVRRRHVWPAAVGAGLVLLAVVLAVLVVGRDPGHVGAGPAAAPTVDPRLVLRPHAAPIGAALTTGVRLRGTMYPAIPGRNTLTLAVQERSPALARSRVAVVVTMPGMEMAPIRAALTRQGDHYSGALTLPMLGVYQAQVALETPSVRATGILTLTLGLPGW